MRLIAALAMGTALLTLSTSAVFAAPAVRAATSEDAPATTASGATYTVPKGWSVRSDGAVSVLSPPEGDAHIAIVEVGTAGSAAEATAKAWQTYDPAFARKVKVEAAQPARNGWDARSVFEYDTAESEHLAISALAQRRGTAWTVTLIDGNRATVEKRGAALGLVGQTLRAAGYKKESFAGRKANPMTEARVAELKAFLKQGMDELGVPGAGLAIIDHGKVVFEGGLGVKELGKPDPVDAHTLFMIASNTKGMSTLLLSELVDDGKLDWNEKVTAVYPAFRLGSDATTAKVLIRNLVCACTGLPRKDLNWILNSNRNTPTDNAFKLLAATEPTSGFGEVFQYNNQMAAAAGFIGAHLLYPDLELGAAYDKAMQVRVFDPLGMNETTFDFARALAGNYALPHADGLDGHPAVVAMDANYTTVPTRPAGGAWSSAHDMIRYVEDELTMGRLPDGKRLVSEKNLLVRRQASVPVGEDAWYGMGLMTDKKWGVEVVHHGGSMLGYKSDWIAIPDADVGVVLLTNADDGQALLNPFMRRVLELLYDGHPEAAADVAATARRAEVEKIKLREGLLVPPPAEATALLAANYTQPELGQIIVRKEADGVTFEFAAFKTHVAARKEKDGAWVFTPADTGYVGFFGFVAGTRDGKPILTVRDGQHEYVYTAKD